MTSPLVNQIKKIHDEGTLNKEITKLKNIKQEVYNGRTVCVLGKDLRVDFNELITALKEKIKRYNRKSTIF